MYVNFWFGRDLQINDIIIVAFSKQLSLFWPETKLVSSNFEKEIYVFIPFI